MVDARAILGRGWPFPTRLGPDGRLGWLDGPAKVRQSIRLLLETSPGERVMLPEYGCGVHDLVFQPNSAQLRSAVRERVRTALVRFEPRIDVVGVDVETAAGEPSRLDISIDYRLRANNAFHNLVFPFYLAEGKEA